jgi:hypothetical protein
MIGQKLFSERLAQFATAQANDAQLIDDIVGRLVYWRKRNLS